MIKFFHVKLFPFYTTSGNINKLQKNGVMQMKNKILSYVIVIALLFSLPAGSVSAEEVMLSEDNSVSEDVVIFEDEAVSKDTLTDEETQLPADSEIYMTDLDEEIYVEPEAETSLNEDVFETGNIPDILDLDEQKNYRIPQNIVDGSLKQEILKLKDYAFANKEDNAVPEDQNEMSVLGSGSDNSGFENYPIDKPVIDKRDYYFDADVSKNTFADTTSSGGISTLGFELVFGNDRAYLYDEVTEESIELFSGGVGTYSDPFLISCANDLYQLQMMVNDMGMSLEGFYFYQTEDIDLETSSRNPWIPIGYVDDYNMLSCFSGIYYGNGHTISGIYVKGNSYEWCGLFSVTYLASLYDINIDDAVISGGYRAAPLTAAAIDTDIVNCNVGDDVSVSSSTQEAILGGIVAEYAILEYECMFSYCLSEATVKSSANDSICGGVVGMFDGYSDDERDIIFGCGFEGKVQGYYAGGILGFGEYFDALACYNEGTVNADLFAGGIAAEGACFSVLECYSSGTVSSDSYAGGLVCYSNYGEISFCYNSGKVTAGEVCYDIVCGWEYTDAYCNYCSNKRSPGGEYVSSSALKKQEYLDYFNFDTSYGYERGENNGYPILKIFYPKLMGVYNEFDGEDPDVVLVDFVSNFNPLLSVVPLTLDCWEVYEGDGKYTLLEIYPEFFEKYCPSGKYQFEANFGAGKVIPFVVTVKNNCIHEYGRSEKVEGSCTETGYYRVYCSACNKLLYEDIYEATGHTFANASAKEPTCAEIGWYAHTYCTKCNYSTDRVERAKLPHELVYHEGKEMTWQEAGWEPYQTCKNCDYTSYKEILPVHPERVEISALNTTIDIGDKTQLTAKVYPENSTNQKVFWSSSDESVLTVDENGLATAHGSGTAKVYATTEDGGVRGELSINVERSITHIEIEGPTTLSVGNKVELKANTYCFEYGEKVFVKGTVEWSSSDTSVATVSSGKVTAVGMGTAIITARVPGRNVVDSIEVTVVAPITSLKFTTKSATVYVGNQFDLGAELVVAPINNTDEIVWESSEDSVCRVDENGILTPVATGKATIKAKAIAGGKTASFSVTVAREPEGIIIEGNNVVAKGKTATLKAYAYYEENGKVVKTKDVISWRTSDENVVTVSKGKIKGVNAGEAVITAYIEGTEIEETFDVNVVAPVTSLKFTPSSATIYVGNQFDLASLLVVAPLDNTDEIVWESSKDSVCRVDENGILTPVSTGKATIKAKAIAGGKTASFSVTVAREPEGIVVEGNNVVAKGKTATLKAYAYYEENGKVVKTKDVISWRTSDENVVTVSKGKIKGVNVGEAVVTAYIEGIDVEVDFDVTVVVPASTVKFSIKKITATVGEEFDLNEYLTVSPEENTDEIIWTTSKSSVAVVEDGHVTIVGKGSVKITAKALAGNKSAYVSITVK